jgi:periplasmic copper chaperone A
VSRQRKMMRPLPAVTARIVACCAIALVVIGCGAGQITQTDSQVAAVDGAYGDVGTIALRDVLIPYPPSPEGTYPAGSSVQVLLTIVNQGDSADELTAVTSPAARQVLLLGTTTIPGRTNVVSTLATGQPTSPLIAGKLRIVLVTNRPLRAGLNTPVTFQFRNAGSVTLLVPMATPPALTGEPA